MTNLPRTRLGEVQNALSHLHLALSEALEGLYACIDFRYDAYPGMGLKVVIECQERNAERVRDIINHGILNGPYDYRFNGTGRRIGQRPDEYVEVTAYPLFNHNEPIEEPKHELSFRDGFKHGWRYHQLSLLAQPVAEDASWKAYRFDRTKEIS